MMRASLGFHFGRRVPGPRVGGDLDGHTGRSPRSVFSNQVG